MCSLPWLLVHVCIKESIYSNHDTYQAISIIEQQLKGILNSRLDMAEAVNGILDSKHPHSDANGGSRRRLERHFSVHKFYNYEDEFDDLKVYCANNNKHMRCEWTGSLNDVVEHMNHECHYSPVSLLSEENVEMPMMIMMRGFEQLKHTNARWYSPVFCTHEKGYHFRLRVDANGWCGTGDAIAVVVSIVKGDYDDQLQWPFEGVISVKVLNHISNSAHSIVKEFEFSGGGYECEQVTDETQPEYGCWYDHFITQNSLPYNSLTNSQYLKNDCLFFLVSYRPLRIYVQ